jgi:arsenate reductase
MTATIYGIKTCDTLRRARSWLKEHGVDHAYHDYRTDGLDAGRLRDWVGKVDWGTLLNRQSTSFRALSDEDKADIDADKAFRLMLREPTMIKRPVLDIDGKLTVGFKPDLYAAATGR